MNFEPSEGQRIACEAARKFYAAELPPARLREVETKGLGAFRPVYRQLGELGFLGLGVPEAYGGSGGTWLDLALYAEEAGRVLAPTVQISSVVLAGQAILVMGDESQKHRWLPALAAGNAILVPAWTEAAEADRSGRLASQVVARGGALELQGTKRFVEGYEVASALLVAARDQQGAPRFHRVPIPGAGISVSAHRLSSLERMHDVHFDGVSVAPEEVLQGDWSGWLQVLDGGKIIVAAWAVGAARAALDMAVAYAKERRQFERPIGSFQALQHRLADAAIAVESATALVRYAAWLRDTGAEWSREAAMARLVAGRTVTSVTHAAMHTFGGYGFMEEYDVQLYFRRAKQLEHQLEGPQLQRELLSEEDIDDGIRVF